jgi:hypothetical protein
MDAVRPFEKVLTLGAHKVAITIKDTESILEADDDIRPIWLVYSHQERSFGYPILGE